MTNILHRLEQLQKKKMRLLLPVQLFVCFSHRWGILLCLNLTHDTRYNLKCLNDYLFTIRCEFNLTSEPQPHDTLDWLEFKDEREQFKCVLTLQTYTWLCELDLSTQVEDTFMDIDEFQISLVYSSHGNKKSVVLMTDYKPVNYIQPVPPLNLTLLWKPDEAVFHWLSGYNKEVLHLSDLKYELSIHTNSKVLDIHPRETSMSVPMSFFAPNANSTARVRSAPNQEHYKGVWSQWSPSIHWNTGSLNTKKKDDTHKSFVTVYMAFSLLFLMWFCYFTYNRWKGCALMQSPTPHIGDFKCSSVMPEEVGKLLLREESLQFDSLVEELSPPAQYECMYLNGNSDNASLPGSARSSNMLQSSGDPEVSCWMQALMSVEKEGVMYSDDYCTLSYTLSENANTHTWAK